MFMVFSNHITFGKSWMLQHAADLTREKLISTQKSKENKAPPWLAAELLEKRSVKELHLSEALHLPILGQCTWAEQVMRVMISLQLSIPPSCSPKNEE